jgi:hypothetical protein
MVIRLEERLLYYFDSYILTEREDERHQMMRKIVS